MSLNLIPKRFDVSLMTVWDINLGDLSSITLFPETLDKFSHLFQMYREKDKIEAKKDICIITKERYIWRQGGQRT